MRILLIFSLLLLSACEITPQASPQTLLHAQPQEHTLPLTTVLEEETLRLGTTEVHMQLSTSAQSDAQGVHWDDGQQWRLTATVGEQHFVLLDEYLNLANVDYWVSLLDNKLTIMVLTSGSAQFTLERFDFQASDNGFKRTLISQADEHWNLLHQSHYH